MALSEREQQVLRDLESQLHEDDPELAQTFQREERRLSRPSPRHIGGGVALVLVGLALLIAGVSVPHSLLSILLGVRVEGLLRPDDGVQLLLGEDPRRGASERAADAVRRRWGSSALAPASLLGGGTGAARAPRGEVRQPGREDEEGR